MMDHQYGRAIELRHRGLTLQQIAEAIGASRLDVFRVLIGAGFILSWMRRPVEQTSPGKGKDNARS